MARGNRPRRWSSRGSAAVAPSGTGGWTRAPIASIAAAGAGIMSRGGADRGALASIAVVKPRSMSSRHPARPHEVPRAPARRHRAPGASAARVTASSGASTATPGRTTRGSGSGSTPPASSARAATSTRRWRSTASGAMPRCRRSRSEKGPSERWVGVPREPGTVRALPRIRRRRVRRVFCRARRMSRINCPEKNAMRYRGSIKHKRWRPGGGYGTLCPEWSHQVGQSWLRRRCAEASVAADEGWRAVRSQPGGRGRPPLRDRKRNRFRGRFEQ